jgi:Na+-transporting methylmalonyl-CoA/oxaloacetate decarboxylase gamma subunit
MVTTRNSTYQVTSQVIRPTLGRTTQEDGTSLEGQAQVRTADETLARAIAAAVAQALANQPAH